MKKTTLNRTPIDFDWDNFDLSVLKPYLKNDLFEGIVGKQEFLLLKHSDSIDIFNSVLIAIHDPDADFHNPKDLEGFRDVLEIKFWDLENKLNGLEPIYTEQGKILKDFIIKNKDYKFFIHCHAGMSRSAGVGCAVECIINENSNLYYYATGQSDIKSHGRYFPNYKVYDTIMKEKE